MTKTILCFDNQRTDGKEISAEAVEILKTFQNLNHKKLREKYKVHLLGEVDETDDKECLFSLKPSKWNEKEGYSLLTSNLMGVVNFSDGKDSLRLVIGSRFDKDENGSLNPEQPFFLHMLQKVFRCDFATDISGSFDLWDTLLAIRFRVLLEQAANIGVLRLYQTFHHNDLRFRGKLDTNNHILKNSLIRDKIAYDTHERTADNPINHLILYAEKYVNRKYPSLLSESQEAESLLKQIRTEVPLFGSKSVQSVANDKNNIKTLRHPYYAEYYEELRRVSLALLCEEGANVFNDEDDSLNGIIISGSWLWEEYVFALMEENKSGFIHANPSKKEHWILRYEGGRHIYPDFRLPAAKGEEQKALIVFDAKYKFNNSIREDLNQIMTYMFLTGADIGGFIYPPQDDEKGNQGTRAGSTENETNDSVLNDILNEKENVKNIIQCTSKDKKYLWSYVFEKKTSDKTFDEMEAGFIEFLENVKQSQASVFAAD